MSVTISGTNGITSNSTVIPNNEVLVTLDDTQTLTNKTLGATTFTGNITSAGNLQVGAAPGVFGAATFSDVSDLNNPAIVYLRNNNSDSGKRLAGIYYNSNNLILGVGNESTGAWAASYGVFSSAGLTVNGKIYGGQFHGDGTNELAILSNNASQGINFYTGVGGVSALSRMTINSSGNIGIGVPPQSAAITSGAKSIALYGGGNLHSNSADNDFRIAANAWINGGTYVFTSETNAFATNYSQGSGSHLWQVSNAQGTAGNGVTWSNVMSLDANGKLTITPTGGDALHLSRGTVVGVRLTASADLYFYDTNGSWTNTARAGGFANMSDIRFKENITDITEDVVPALMQLNPIRYKVKGGNGNTQIGFSAQNVKEVFPEFVYGQEDDAGYALNYSQMTAILCKAIQELNSELNTTKARLAVLENK